MNSTLCEDFTNHSTVEVMEAFRKWYIPTISLIGCIGNFFSLFVLFKIKDCFHRLLFGLAICDLIVPLFASFLLFLNLFKQGRMSVWEIVPNAVMEAGFTGSGWMTVAISLERFLGICHPMNCPPANRKARFLVLPVLLLTLLDFFLSAILLGLFGRVPSQLLHEIIIYFHILIQYICPAAVVLVLNAIIVHSVIKISSQDEQQRRMSRTRNSAAVLIIVVLVYIICWSPFYIIDFTFLFLPTYNGCNLGGGDQQWVDRFWVAVLRKTGGCSIITNSCINFVIYCFVGRTFRKRFLATFLPRRRHLPRSRLSSTRMSVLTSRHRENTITEFKAETEDLERKPSSSTETTF